MRKLASCVAAVGSLCLLVPILVLALPPCGEARIAEHLPWGLPGLTEPTTQTYSLQIAYVTCFNTSLRCPEWSAYHARAAYKTPPKREGEYETMRDHLNADADAYTHTGFDRGHLAPYRFSGGSREDTAVGCSGLFCDEAVFQINYMTNVAPQYPSFNRSGGLWYELENMIARSVDKIDVWVIAGTIFWDGVATAIGPERAIRVPDAFYQIVAWEVPDSALPQVLCFLFPHQRGRAGEVRDFLASVDLVEALTGFDFFALLSDADEAALEACNTARYWDAFAALAGAGEALCAQVPLD